MTGLKDAPILEDRRKQFTLKDMLIIAALVINPVIWWTQVNTHLSSKELHPSRKEREVFVDERIDMKLGNRYSEFRAEVLTELSDIKKGVAETKAQVARIEGRLAERK